MVKTDYTFFYQFCLINLPGAYLFFFSVEPTKQLEVDNRIFIIEVLSLNIFNPQEEIVLYDSYVRLTMSWDN